MISPEKQLHQLKAHFFLTLMSKFYSICDKGSRLNYFFNLGTYFHIGTKGFLVSFPYCNNLFYSSRKLYYRTLKSCRISGQQVDFFSLYSYGKRCASKWLILFILFSCAATEIYFRRLLPKRKVI